MKLTILSGLLLVVGSASAVSGDDQKYEQKVDTSVFANTRLRSLMENVESKADRFEDKLDAALNKSTLKRSQLGQWMNTWSESLEDELDDMAEDFAEKDSAEFNTHLESSMLMASAINRAMLRHEFSSAAEAEWRGLRAHLNDIAMLLRRPALPNLTVVTFTTPPPDFLARADIRQVMDELEASTDRFRDKFEHAWFTTIAPEDQKRLFKNWSDALEDTSDQMLDEFKANDANDTREKLEQTLLLAAGINRMMLGSTTSQTPLAEWNAVRHRLNTLAQVFGYPVLPDKAVSFTRTGAVR